MPEKGGHMPNEYDKNWIRIWGTIVGFRIRLFGRFKLGICALTCDIRGGDQLQSVSAVSNPYLTRCDRVDPGDRPRRRLDTFKAISRNAFLATSTRIYPVLDLIRSTISVYNFANSVRIGRRKPESRRVRHETLYNIPEPSFRTMGHGREVRSIAGRLVQPLRSGTGCTERAFSRAGCVAKLQTPSPRVRER